MLIFRVVILRLSVLSTFVPFKILHFLPFSKRGWESLFTLQCLYYPFLVCMFYVNMHIVSRGGSFWVTVFGQSFHITYLSIRCVLDMRQLDACLHFILPSKGLVSHSWRAFFYILVLLYGALRQLLAYIPLVSFSKPTQILATFLTYILSILYTIIPRFADRLLMSFMSSSQDNNSISSRSSSHPLLRFFLLSWCTSFQTHLQTVKTYWL